MTPHFLRFVDNAVLHQAHAHSTAPVRSLRPEPRPDGLGGSAPAVWPRPRARPADLAAAAEDAASRGSRDPECLSGNCPQCEIITSAMLATIFTGATPQELSDLAEGLNYNISDGKIDTHLRISHFLGQVREEVTQHITLRESLYYTSKSRLQQMFSYFRRNPQEADRVLLINPRAAREEAIANLVYMDANRSPGYRLGNTQPGDGWRYRGRGLKQLTGRDNYRSFTAGHTAIWGEEVDFEANPDRVSEPKYSVRSGLWFWVSRRCHVIADGGMTRAVSERITNEINRGIGADSRTNRWNHSNRIYGSNVFRRTCWNRSWINSNAEARVPRQGGPR